tara:strand:- start:10860 stop:12290 length:1431 start_codon:yes stop_codon:yes gene_type:complete
MKICIVGSSFASAVLAKNISKKGFDVNIIDIGDISKVDQNKYLKINKSSTINLKKNEFQFHGWGGGSNLWHGVLTTFDNPDLEKFKKLGVNFLKIYEKYQNLSLSFLKIKNKFKNTKLISSSSIYKKCLNNNFFKEKYFLVQKKPFQTKNIFLDLEHNNKIKLINNACALDLFIKNNKVIFLNYFDTKKKINKKFYADIFILCSGAIETPRILLQSKLKKFKNSYDKIGKGINDHYKGVVGQIEIKDSEHFFDLDLNGKVSSRLGFIQSKLIEGNFCIILRKIYDDIYVKITQRIKNFLYKKSFLNFYALLKVLSFKGIYLLIKKLVFNIKVSKKASFEIWLETKTNDKNSVKLSSKKDRFGRIIPNVNFKFSTFEMRQINYSQKILTKIFKKKFKIIKFKKKNFSSGAHFSNTCRIGNNVSDSVVNKNLKLHSVNNLYICDNSVLNFTGNSNPTFSLINLALRLSVYLRSKYKIK